jgi:hypothetical protein
VARLTTRASQREDDLLQNFAGEDVDARHIELLFLHKSTVDYCFLNESDEWLQLPLVSYDPLQSQRKRHD